MASALSNLVINLSEGINKVKYKHAHNDRKCETCKNCKCFLKYKDFNPIGNGGHFLRGKLFCLF